MGGESQQVTKEEAHICNTPTCSKIARLRCPTCLKSNIDTYFCSQECFRSSWAVHKLTHAVKNNSYNPWPYYQFTGKLRPFPVTSRRDLPEVIVRPDYAERADGLSEEEEATKNSNLVKILNDLEMGKMRVVCRMAREVLDEVANAIEPGLTTDQIDQIVHEECIERECYPSPLGYHQFPKSVCTSVNEVVCHGIPDTRPLENGDICNVDVTVYHRGFHGDLNETFLVGDQVDEPACDLVRVAYECLEQAIGIVRPGTRFREIGNIIQKHASAHGYSVVKNYCGHGIHRLFHTAPSVPHFARNRASGVMRAGNTFTIEPMINAGVSTTVRWPDNWTAVTADGKLSAQFEHTLLVTDEGCEVLTARSTGRPWFMDHADWLKFKKN